MNPQQNNATEINKTRENMHAKIPIQQEGDSRKNNNDK